MVLDHGVWNLSLSHRLETVREALPPGFMPSEREVSECLLDT
jgi:hypothetical protein